MHTQSYAKSGGKWSDGFESPNYCRYMHKKAYKDTQTVKVLLFSLLLYLWTPMVTAALISNEQVQSFVNSGTPLKKQLPTYLALHSSDITSISKNDDSQKLERQLLRKLDCTYVYLSEKTNNNGLYDFI